MERGISLQPTISMDKGDYVTTERDRASFRGLLEFLRKEGDVLVVKGEVDPIYEIAGIEKAFDNGPALLFEKIKGYPDARIAGNVFSRLERLAKVFNVVGPGRLRSKCLEALKSPIPPKVIAAAPCQEVVISQDLDVMSTLPFIKHTERDAGRILGGGCTLLYGKYFAGGSHLSFNRMHFRGKDWASIHAVGGTHLGDARLRHKGEKIPVTINIANPPAVTMVAATTFPHALFPPGTDELGFAGALQGFPVEIVKAKTVDTYAIAQAEWVIEGYLDTTQRGVWESDEAEKAGVRDKYPFFPEWPGYMGRAQKTVKFQATAITHRADDPIFFTPLAHSYEGEVMGIPFRAACFYELAHRLFPGLVVDVSILPAIAGWGANIVFQVSKSRDIDDAYVRALINAAFSTAQHLRLVVVVDQDVDVSTADGVLWAITTRADPATDIIGGGGGMGQIQQPGARKTQLAPQIPLVGGIGIDATIRFEQKDSFERARYPVHLVDLTRWFCQEEIEGARRLQGEYARVLAEKGW